LLDLHLLTASGYPFGIFKLFSHSKINYPSFGVLFLSQICKSIFWSISSWKQYSKNVTR